MQQSPIIGPVQSYIASSLLQGALTRGESFWLLGVELQRKLFQKTTVFRDFIKVSLDHKQRERLSDNPFKDC